MFDGLHHHRWVAAFGFAEQQMDVLGHHHTTGDDEVVASAHLLQHVEKQVATVVGTQQRAPPITAGGEEVEMSGTVIAMESVGHRRVVT